METKKQRETERERSKEIDPTTEASSPNSQMKANGCVQFSEAAHLEEWSLPM